MGKCRSPPVGRFRYVHAGVGAWAKAGHCGVAGEGRGARDRERSVDGSAWRCSSSADLARCRATPGWAATRSSPARHCRSRPVTSQSTPSQVGTGRVVLCCVQLVVTLRAWSQHEDEIVGRRTGRDQDGDTGQGQRHNEHVRCRADWPSQRSLWIHPRLSTWVLRRRGSPGRRRRQGGEGGGARLS